VFLLNVCYTGKNQRLKGEVNIFMIRTLINWLVSALILWLMSFIPFLDISFDGVLAIIITAIVIGLINALIVPIVKGIFKGKNNNATLLIIIISLIIDAAALWLAGIIVPGFSIGFFPTAIIAAIVLTILNAGFASAKSN
jgi:putative membrane protein